MFRPIEQREFEGTQEQYFLVGYRAVCHEVYQKAAAVNSYEIFRGYLDKGKNIEDQLQIQREIKRSEKSVEKGLEDFLSLKATYDRALKNGNLQDFHFCEIELNGDLSIVAAGPITPEFLPDGKKIQSVDNLVDDLENALIGFTTRGNSFSLIFSWPKFFSKVTEYIESLIKIRSIDLPDFILETLFTHIENIYFSESWWNALQPSQKEKIMIMIRTYHPHTECIRARGSKYLNWSLKKIRTSFSNHQNSEATNGEKP
jgi:hypothetical protein